MTTKPNPLAVMDELVARSHGLETNVIEARAAVAELVAAARYTRRQILVAGPDCNLDPDCYHRLDRALEKMGEPVFGGDE